MPTFGPFAALVEHARSWPVASQHVARRNAMVACTALAARRAEREDVEEFFARFTTTASATARRLAARG